MSIYCSVLVQLYTVNTVCMCGAPTMTARRTSSVTYCCPFMKCQNLHV
jgi:hypothetical protein